MTTGSLGPVRRLWSRRRLLRAAPALSVPAALLGRDAREATAATVAGDSVEVELRQFGARGDGISDDTDAFRAMHAHLVALQTRSPHRRFVIRLAPGHYRYRWNRWTWGLRDVTVIGYGAYIQCISNSMYHFDKYALVTNRDFFDEAGPFDEPGQRLRYGHEIATTRPGDLWVELKSPARAAEYGVGRYVLVMSYDQQFYGYPPNCRYFEFARVAAVEAGRIRLDRPLQHRHSESFLEGADPHSCGRARLLPIDRDDVPLAMKQRLFGLTSLPNPHREGTGQHVAAIGVLDFVARDCSFVSFVAGCGDRFAVEGTSIEDAEPDKLVNAISFNNCRISLITEATGVNSARFTNCQFEQPVGAEARSVVFDSCVFRGALYPGTYRYGIDLKGFAPTRSLVISNCVFYGRRGTTIAAVSENQMVGLPLAPPARIRENRVIDMPGSDPRVIRLVKTIETGSLLLVSGGEEDTPGSDGRFGLVEDIVADSDRVHIQARFSGPIGPGDTVWVARVRQVLGRGNVFVDVGDGPPWAPLLDWSPAAGPSGTRRFGLTSSGPVNVEPIVAGHLLKIGITVVTPYAGPGQGSFLRIFSGGPAFGRFFLVVDCRTPGRREITRQGVQGAQPGDRISVLPPDLFVWTVKLQFALEPQANEATPPGRPDQQAHCLVTIEADDRIAAALSG